MPFFLRGHGKKKLPTKKKLIKGKRGRTETANGLLPSKKQRKDVESEGEEEITSDEDEEFLQKIKKRQEEVLHDENEEETAQEKKVRLAKKYLEELQNRAKDDVGSKNVGLQLKEDVLEAAGQLQKSVANSLECPDFETVKVFKHKFHKSPLTCLVVSTDESLIFTASKDCTIVKWSIHGERKGYIPRCLVNSEHSRVGHSSHVLSLALSTDSKFLASGDRDGIIHIWDPATLTHLKTFKKHRGAVSGLIFRRGTHTLFSASYDRLVMSWNLDAMAFAESLGGHHDCITGIDALNRESCITSGGRDEMIIVYVIPEDKQLRFSAHQSSIDGVKLINEKTFITFGQNGSLALWTTLKKKPHFIIPAAHGKNPDNGEPNWITAVVALVNTDVIASGSMDGHVRLWKVEVSTRRLEPLFTIALPGVINSLAFTQSGSHLLAAVGKEHKLGRWFTEQSAKNSLVIIPLKKKIS